MAWLRADSVWKRFMLQKDRADSVGQLLVRMLPGRQRPKSEPFWALRDVSFEMPTGTSLGIIGTNGSGKSTTLKLLTHTMVPTCGSVLVHGKVSALIELGAGFHPDFTGRENIVLNASILGVRRRDVEKRMDDIIDFSGIQPFIDTPVKYYSSGMQARLGFSVAIHVDAEILVVDEVLAVGDQSFQQKCMQRISELKRSGVGILLVSHDLSSIERLVDRAVWLDRGVVRATGSATDVVRRYRAHDEGSVAAQTQNAAAAGRTGALAAQVQLAVGGRAVEHVNSGEDVDLTIELKNELSTSLQGYLNVVIRRADGLALVEISGLSDGAVLLVPPGITRSVLALRGLHLAQGVYGIDAAFESAAGTTVARWDSIARLDVRTENWARAPLLVPHHWQIEQNKSTATWLPTDYSGRRG